METNNLDENQERLGNDPCEEASYQVSRSMNPKDVQIGRKARFKCDVCEKTFKRTSNLSFHKRVHNGERPHECEVCHKKFYSLFNLSRHQRVHTGERPHKCNICEKSFVLSGNLANHQKVHADEKFLRDKGSEKSLPFTGWSQQSEAESDETTLYKCKLCTKSFTRANLWSHMANFHQAKELYKYDVDENGLQTTSQLLVHHGSCSNKKLNECSTCGKKFKYASGLSRHKKFHTGETVETIQDDKKNYMCKICDKVFSYSSGLSRHMRIHRPRTLPFKCKICKKSFTQASYLSQHLNRQKNHNTEEIRKSDFCSEGIKHLFSSTHGEKAYPGSKSHHSKASTDKVTDLFNLLDCTDQGKYQHNIFNQRFNYLSHNKKIHIRGEVDTYNQLTSLSPALSILDEKRPYECKNCQKSFTEQSVLQVHQKSCAGAKSYKCKRCDVFFNQLCDFLSHQRSHTAKVS